MQKIFGILILLSLLLSSCSTQPEPINYGSDACHFCKMTIVTKTHSAQAVSTKGKQFKYDAIECMVNDINTDNKVEMAVKQVANYLNPGEMIPAEKATYIISSNIPSPMGANLSAIATKQEAEELKKHNGGDLFDWNALKARNYNPGSGHHH